MAGTTRTPEEVNVLIDEYTVLVKSFNEGFLALNEKYGISPDILTPTYGKDKKELPLGLSFTDEILTYESKE